MSKKDTHNEDTHWLVLFDARARPPAVEVVLTGHVRGLDDPQPAREPQRALQDVLRDLIEALHRRVLRVVPRPRAAEPRRGHPPRGGRRGRRVDKVGNSLARHLDREVERLHVTELRVVLDLGHEPPRQGNAGGPTLRRRRLRRRGRGGVGRRGGAVVHVVHGRRCGVGRG